MRLRNPGGQGQTQPGVIGAAATKPGTYLLRGFIVDYRTGGTRYSAPQQIRLRICASVPSCP